MSGDVQPRKRKDKRRKKEGGSLGNIHESISPHKFKRNESDDKKVFDLPDQGEKIHVQSEHGVGGNICVKIIFFCLFGLLVGAVGLIYMKSLGSTDVDLPTIEESRFAEYFTGWLDDNSDDHEPEAHESTVDLDEHDEHDENDEHDDHEDHEDHDDHDEEEENENEEDENSVQDSIYKLFGLQTDEPDEVEESHMEVNKVTETEESQNRQDVYENEESAEEEDEEDEDDEEEEKSDMKSEEQEEENEMKLKEDEEDDENEGKDDEEDEDDEVDDDNDDEDEEEKNDMEDDEKEENEEGNTDIDSGVDLEEKDNYESDENEIDLSQEDEEDEDKYENKPYENEESERTEDVNAKEEEEEEEDDDDDDDDYELNKKKNAIKEIEDYDNDGYDNNNAENNIKEEEESEEEEEINEEKENLNFKTDDDDLGYEEIDISEEDLKEEIEDKLKVNQDEGEIEDETEEDIRKMFFKSNRKESVGQVESNIEGDAETEETDSGGVAVKLGVGIALIIVAHLVLVKKWKSMRNALSDENTSAEIETVLEKKEIENLQSSNESMISRRQTLVPENICFNNEVDDNESEDVEEEEENIEEDEEYYEKEVEEEEFKKSNNDGWEIFKKQSWNENEEGDEGLDNEEPEDDEEEEFEEEDVEEISDEQEEEEDEEEEEEEEEEDYEEDVNDDETLDKNDFVKQKLQAVDDEERQEATETTPTPPPRTKTGRGAQEVDEDFSNHFEETNKVEETSQSSPKAVDETNNYSGPEEQKTPEAKVGNEDEWAFRQELDFADEQFENNPKAAVKVYDEIISKKPTLIRALIGRARALDHWAEKEKSNSYLNQAINAYKSLLVNHGHLLDDEIYVKMAERCIERMRFAGALVSAIDIHKALISKYPNFPKYRNTLAVTYLMLNKIPQARVLLNETLRLWPEDGFALVHYGFILKTSDNNMEEGAKKLMAGIQTRQEGVIDGMFFFHLGDALNRLGRGKEAMKWYELGVKEGLFLSKYQRSLYNVNRLKGQPWWTKEETTYQDFFKKLEDNWREIRREGLELLHSKGVNLFKEEAENLKESGDWKQLDLYFRGRKQASCNKAPITCSVVSSFKPASTCTRGQIKFSVMLPNTHVWPHCGPTNCRLRSHLGLVVPKKTFIRVAEETRSWEEGKVIIFDDSFEHEVWHNGTGLRLVLIVDVWHPELTSHERRSLSPI